MAKKRQSHDQKRKAKLKARQKRRRPSPGSLSPLAYEGNTFKNQELIPAVAATESGIVFWLVGLNPTVLATIRRAGLHERLGDRMLFNARAAIARYRTLPAGTPEALTAR